MPLMISLILESGKFVPLQLGDRSEIQRITSDECGPAEQIGVFTEFVGLAKLLDVGDDLVLRNPLTKNYMSALLDVPSPFNRITTRRTCRGFWTIFMAELFVCSTRTTGSACSSLDMFSVFLRLKDDREVRGEE